MPIKIKCLLSLAYIIPSDISFALEMNIINQTFLVLRCVTDLCTEVKVLYNKSKDAWKYILKMVQFNERKKLMIFLF